MFKTFFRTNIVLLSFISFLLIPATGASAISNTKDIEEVGIEEKLGDPVPLDTVFLNESGNRVKLEQFFDGKRPVILNLVYFSCPRVCTFGITGLLEVINSLESLEPGTDYRVLTLSFNPDEGHVIANEKSDKFKSGLRDGVDHDSWSFLTGTRDNIRTLTDSLGFRFKKDGDEYAHPSALVIFTPEGRISRYLYGIEHNTKDLKLSLLEAADGEIGSSETLNKVLLYCYQFDPLGKKYALQALNVVKVGGVVTLLCLGAFLAILWKREKRDS